jgi:hypothetical protein
MQTVAAYFQNGDFANADTLLNAVADQHLAVSGKDIRVPPVMKNLIGAWVGTVAATRTSAQIQSPSLRPLANQEVSLMFGAANGMSDDDVVFWQKAPRELAEDESVNFQVNTDDAAAQDHMALMWLSDGPLQPVNGKIITIRATAAITQVNGVWTAGALTFTQKLPVTDYQIVGMRAIAASGQGARLILPGSPWRPGCIVSNANSVSEFGLFRYGNMGVWGEFNINQPPQLEMFGGTATAQTVFLDLIRK